MLNKEVNKQTGLLGTFLYDHITQDYSGFCSIEVAY